MQVVGSKFEDVAGSFDVVYFEFCLHEMHDPEKALIHAKKLAPDIVVFDHSPGCGVDLLCRERRQGPQQLTSYVTLRVAAPGTISHGAAV